MFDQIALVQPRRSFPHIVLRQLRAGARAKTVADQHGVPIITILFIAEAFAQAGELTQSVADRISAGRQ